MREVNLPNYEKIAAVERLGNWILCHRCGMRTSVIVGQLADYGYFVHIVLYLGDATLNKIYICLISLKQNLEKSSFWTGQLTEKQTEIAKRILCHSEKRHHLIWAVTGAGKTEMLYPILVETLKAGGRVAICTPRVDVCNELFYAIVMFFQKKNHVAPWEYSNGLYLYFFCYLYDSSAIPFYRSFDLIVIDEIDAFPYNGDAG